MLDDISLELSRPILIDNLRVRRPANGVFFSNIFLYSNDGWRVVRFLTRFPLPAGINGMFHL